MKNTIHVLNSTNMHQNVYPKRLNIKTPKNIDFPSETNGK